jgi:hypothetical protein
MGYYNGTRTHLSLNKDAPMSRAAENAVPIILSVARSWADCTINMAGYDYGRHKSHSDQPQSRGAPDGKAPAFHRG